MDETEQDELLRQLTVTFLEELEEHAASINRDLLNLETEVDAARRRDLFITLFRAAHSLKGAARSIGVTPVEAACHRLEDILAAARDGRAELAADQFSLFFAAVDALRDAGGRLRNGQDLNDGPLAEVTQRLNLAAEGLGHASSGNAVAAPAGEEAAAEEPSEDPAEDPRQNGPLLREPAAQRAAAPEAGPAGAFLRVRAEKLDVLIAHSSELLVTRQRIEARAEQLQLTSESVKRLRLDWGSAEGRLRSFVEREAAPEANGAAHAAEWLETFVAQMGDRIRKIDAELERLNTALAGDRRQFGQTATAVNDQIYAVRMVPFTAVTDSLRRAVRDLSRATGKQVNLQVAAGDIELDRSILEGLRDPLLHLVRNAVDHGVEAPADRQAAGKPAQATVVVAVSLSGPQVEVAVTDDGRGLDLEAIRRQAVKRGIPVPADDHELARLIFLPNFSTSSIITDISGRGVGLDVVKAQVEAMQGSVEIDSRPGAGARITLTVPLTLTTQRVVLVVSRGRTFALPSFGIEKILRLGAADLRTVEGQEVVLQGAGPVPVAVLGDVLGLEERGGGRPGKYSPAVLLRAGGKRAIFLVDDVLAEQDVLVKGLGALLLRVRYAAGATVLPSGQVALLLNSASVVRQALTQAPARRVVDALTDKAPGQGKRRVICVDDSLTTRSMVKSRLEAAGYEVTAAGDGETAWQLLQQQGAELIVSDVDMPGMDGFMLTHAIRNSPRFSDLPVILITARTSDRDRARGAEVGASAYLTKSTFDQRVLLETIGQLM